jgi:polyhydroxyalkanoate synthesis regulator phasin
MDKKLEQLVYAALGGALAVKEKIETNNDEIKACQEKSEEKARIFLYEMAQRGEEETDQFKDRFKAMLKEVVAELNLATRDDLEKLKQELAK